VAKGIQVAQAELGVAPSRDIKLSSGRGERIAKIGTLVSAIMASACCWLPLVLLAVGVSGAGIASTLEAYRPLFMVVTFSFLAAAFYYTYRPRKSADGVGQGCCDAEETKNCCDSATKGRFNMMSLNKVMLWAVTAMAVVFLLFPSYVGVLRGTSGNRTVTENMNITQLKIEGMTCEGCTSIAEKAILVVPGVLAADVDFEKKLATVGTDKGSLISADQIMQALRRVGYGARLVGSQAEKELHNPVK
jgi:copper chaperone CopZ